MTKEQIAAIVAEQRQFFTSCATLSVAKRIQSLKKLRKEIQKNEENIAEAIRSDLGKSACESYMCETGLIINEISHMLKHIKRYAKDKRVKTPLVQFASRSYIKTVPYGVVLIMSPWNYPFLLTLGPLVDALAAGNTVVVKPSAYSPNTSRVIKELLQAVFPASYVAVIEGGREENTYLLDEKFDYIFFTGGKTVGQLVMEKAAAHLTPITLELGGKSPCIVDDSAHIALAARRIVFGKFLNLGQTCVAPDYILCHESVKDALLEKIREEIRKQFGENPLENDAYGNLINRKHFDKVLSLMDKNKLFYGGKADAERLKIEPTVLEGVTTEDPIMGEEIFGPLLPVLTFRTIDQAIEIVSQHPTPLACYIFSSNKKTIRRITGECAFGGGCVNDVVIHLATSHMGFGGVGESGMGSYHGKTGFQTFSHKKSIVDKKTWLDLPMRYQPYKKLYDRMIHLFLR